MPTLETLMLFTIEKIDVSSAKSFMFDIKLLGRSFMYMKNSNTLKIDLCGTPAFPTGILTIYRQLTKNTVFSLATEKTPY